ncbi:MAG: SDR family oxidoreductase [Proteobacteria bacterium]|nr:SDR family oxidoreductase [Pseudomonadota bacterium]MBI3498696.1 SDR family oxidoreductase [Pseudomonadota bacterium]
MPFEFKGRRVVVAGGSKGIGRSIALGFAEAGAKVSICARGAEALEKTRTEIAKFGGTAHAESCDLADGAAIARYIPAAAKALGGIDVLVNNASGFGPGDDEASWEASIDVDILATIRASRAALPYLEKTSGGAIINIASGSGLRPSVRTPAYGAAKAAVIHYTRTQAAMLARKQIRVNCVAPGSVEFPGGVWAERKKDDPELYKATLANCPAGRMGKPEEVAHVVMFLASPLASWVTAQIIGVNGGQGL